MKTAAPDWSAGGFGWSCASFAWRWIALLSLALVLGSTRASAAEGDPPPWEAMDYGPFLTASIEVPGARTNIAYKGVAIRLGRSGENPGAEAVLFDTDLLRYAAGWSGRFVALKGIVFDGEHWAYPRLDGRQVYSNPPAPGWSGPDGFADPRPLPYGPLPRDWAHWKGLHVHGDRVVLAYTVGGDAVLESPAVEHRGALAVFVRTVNLGPWTADREVQVADGGPSRPIRRGVADNRAVDQETPAREALLVMIASGGEGPTGGEPQPLAGEAEVLAVGLAGGTGKERWIVTPDGQVRLRCPSDARPNRFKILVWRGPANRLGDFTRGVRDAGPTEDLEPLTRGGPRRWAADLETTGRLGPSEGPYAIDELTAPEVNPWNSWLRFSGLDFFPDGRRLAVATWNGDVWIVDGVEGDLARLTWRRVASGLFQPLGLKVVDGAVYVLGRDQITRLVDRNGDGETDFYENFNNDGQVSEHFHEFANDLKLGADGDFYYLKCARHALPASHAHHGTLMRVARDGSRSEVVARGFRAVNGLGLGPGGAMTTVDNQGHWMPANRINWVRPGGWYGNQWAWNPEGRTDFDPPLCWVHNAVDRSGGTHLWVPTDRWGPLEGALITLSYGMGQMFLVLTEEVDGVMQGALTRLPVEFDTGVMRGVFHPVDHQLYACGLYGWAGNKTRPGALYRIRHTGRPLVVPRAMHAVRDGLVLEFTGPLDPEAALEPGRYELKAWNYRWSAQYGSPDFKRDGTQGRDTWRIEEVALSADGRTVFLRVPEVQPVMQWHLEYRLVSADGVALQNLVHGTIHRVGSASGLERVGPSPRMGRAREIADTGVLAGLRQVLWTGDDTEPRDVRAVRLAALHVDEGAPVSAFVPAGPFRARWEGLLRLDLQDTVRFELQGSGAARLAVRGRVVWEGNFNGAGEPSDPVPLPAGMHRLELDYTPPPSGPASLRLLWSSPAIPLEPIPPQALAHQSGDVAQAGFQAIREARRLYASRLCARCHETGFEGARQAMPELEAEAPRFDGIGDRLNEAWMARWILDPRGERAEARMPKVLRGPQAADEARDIAAFLASLRGENRAGAEGVADGGKGGAVQEGRRLFGDLGCVACHLGSGERPGSGDTRTSLTHVGSKWKAAALREYLMSPQRDHRWSRMPDFRLTEDEAGALGEWLTAEGRGTNEGRSPAGDGGRGREWVAARGCLNCHALEGHAVAGGSGAAAFGDLRDWASGCLAEEEAGRGGAPWFGLGATERGLLRRLGGGDADPDWWLDTPLEFAERQYRELRCWACHGRDGETDFWSGLDGQRRGGGEDEEGTGSVHWGRPALTHAGEKLYSDWVRALLAGEKKESTRLGMAGRMPAFPAYASGLAEGMAHQHGFGAGAAEGMRPDAGLAEIGRRLVGVEGGFSCVSCHGVGSAPALAGPDTATVNFSLVAERLRPSYYRRYVLDPPRVMPGTMMPKFVGDDGRTALTTVFGGDAGRQFEAIWHYLHALSRRGPEGVAE